MLLLFLCQRPPLVDLSINSPTGIAPFDELLGGGFPKGSVVLVAGSSGSGKTIFCFQWLFQGVKNNENGLYISLTEPLFKSVKNLETMSFYDRTALEQERLKIADLRAALHLDGRIEKENLNSKRILDYIEQEVKKTNAKRLCIDSVAAIAYMLEDKAKIRAFIFELGKMLAALGCTSLLTSEVTEDGKYSGNFSLLALITGIMGAVICFLLWYQIKGTKAVIKFEYRA